MFLGKTKKILRDVEGLKAPTDKDGTYLGNILKLSNQISDVQAPPLISDIKGIYEAILEEQGFTKDWENVDSKILRKVHYVLNYSSEPDGPRLIDFYESLEFLLVYLGRLKKYSLIKYLVIEIFKSFSISSNLRARLLSKGLEGLKARDKGSIKEFVNNVESLNLFEPKGLTNLFDALIGLSDDRGELLLISVCLDKNSFVGHLGKLFSLVLVERLESISSFQDHKEIIRLLKLLNYNSGHEQRNVIVKGLLLPFQKERPGQDSQREIISYIDLVLGDPRRNSHNWFELEEARAIYLKWQIGKVLDLFFKIIDASTSNDDHSAETWQKRRTIHMRLYELDLFDDAFLILGARSEKFKNKFIAEDDLPTGRMAQEPDNAALLLKVRGYTILEFSIGGAMRIWGSEERAPEIMTHKEYSISGDLKIECKRPKISHDAHGAWVSKFLNGFIWKELGEKINVEEI